MQREQDWLGEAEQFFEADARQAVEDAEEVVRLAESIIRPS